MTTKWVEDLTAGDVLTGGDIIEHVEHIRVGPDWIVAVWVKGANHDGSGLPTITWPIGAEVELEREGGA